MDINTTAPANTSDLATDVLETKEDSGFQWEFLVAALVSALLFFLLGFGISVICRRKQKKPRRWTPPPKNYLHIGSPFDDAATSLTGTSAEQQQVEAPVTDEETPKSVPVTDTKISVAEVPGGYHQSLRDNHRHIRYIDDSDDEDLVRSMGRPPRIVIQKDDVRSHTLPRRSRSCDDHDPWRTAERTSDGSPPIKPPRSFSYRGPPKTWKNANQTRDDKKALDTQQKAKSDLQIPVLLVNGVPLDSNPDGQGGNLIVDPDVTETFHSETDSDGGRRLSLEDIKPLRKHETDASSPAELDSCPPDGVPSDTHKCSADRGEDTGATSVPNGNIYELAANVISEEIMEEALQDICKDNRKYQSNT